MRGTEIGAASQRLVGPGALGLGVLRLERGGAPSLRRAAASWKSGVGPALDGGARARERARAGDSPARR